MNIYAVITNNNVAAAQTICYNTVPAGLTGTALPGEQVSTVTSGRALLIMSLSIISQAQQAADYAPPALTATTWYRRIVNSGPCTNISGSIQITVYANLTAGTVQSAQSICYNTAPAPLHRQQHQPAEQEPIPTSGRIRLIM